jgi:hypothetical protein
MGTVTERDSIVPTQVEAAGQSRGGWVGGGGVGRVGSGTRHAAGKAGVQRQETEGRALSCLLLAVCCLLLRWLYAANAASRDHRDATTADSAKRLGCNVQCAHPARA